MEDYFYVNIVIPRNIDEKLVIEKDSSGVIDYTIISDLEDLFNSTFDVINPILQKEFIRYIDEQSTYLKTDINTQKHIVKKITKKYNKLKKHDTESEVLIYNKFWSENQLLACYEEQYKFLKKWGKEKRKFVSKKQKTQVNQIENKPSLKEKIEEAFNFMQFDDPRKHKKILTDEDYDKLIKWVSYYFDNEFTLPKITNPIQVVNTSKGNITTTFKKIFKQEFPLASYPPSLFQLYISIFSQFKDDSEDNFKKSKEPKSYMDLINKNK